MTNQRAIILLSQMYLPAFDEEEKEAITKAIEALTAQEPRVMTLEEARNTYVIEYKSGNMRKVGAQLLSLDLDPANVYYGEIYRVWTSCPTDEQRKAVKWDV